MVRNCLHQQQVLPVSVINLETNDLFLKKWEKKPKFCSHPVHSCCIFPLPSKGRLKIHVFTIATLPINMEFKTQYYRNIRQKYTPLKMQMNWNKLMVSEIAWLWVGLEKEFWRFLNLDSLLDFCVEGGFILYGKCFMVFGSVWSVSWSSPWGKKYPETKSRQILRNDAGFTVSPISNEKWTNCWFLWVCFCLDDFLISFVSCKG